MYKSVSKMQTLYYETLDRESCNSGIVSEHSSSVAVWSLFTSFPKVVNCPLWLVALTNRIIHFECGPLENKFCGMSYYGRKYFAIAVEIAIIIN